MNYTHETQIYELDDYDGKIWCRPIDAPRSEPWRPVSYGVKTKSEAARILRSEGYHVTRRKSGL